MAKETPEFTAFHQFTTGSGVLLEAMIVDCYAYLHTYLVRAAREPAWPALDIGRGTGLDLLSTRGYGMYRPLTRVLVYRANGGRYGYILGPLPPESRNTTDTYSDFLVPEALTTYKDEVVHNLVQSIMPRGLFASSNNSRPVDVFPGEQGWINSLGVGAHLGLFHASLRSSPLCGVWAFYLNQMLRLSGERIQTWSGARESWSGVDGAECNEIELLGAYAHEMAGKDRPGEDNTVAGSETWEAGKGAPRRLDSGLRSRFRQLRLSGALGGGFRHYMLLPSADAEGVDMGLARAQINEDGAVLWESARSIGLHKTLFIPVPRQLKAPDDPTGDRDNPAIDAARNPVVKLEEPLLMAEDHRASVSAGANARLKAHQKDWKLPSGEEIADDLGAPSELPPVTSPRAYRISLADLMKVVRRVNPDPAAPEQTYYATRAGIDLLDNGDVVLFDGSGSEIRMSGGNIEFTCRGDVFLRPGRSVRIWAPRDLDLRAGNCVDLSASTGDMRIKSERHMQLLSGNGGTGMFLIDARGGGELHAAGRQGEAVQAGGIVALARNGQITLSGREALLRSTAGRLMLSAADGEHELVTSSSVQRHLVQHQTQYLFGPTLANEQAIAAYELHTASSVVFSQTGSVVMAAGQLGVLGAVVTGGSVLAGGRVGSGGNVNGHLSVASVGDSINAIAMGMATSGSLLSERLDSDRTEQRREGSHNNAKELSALSFSFRTDDDYGIEGFCVMEAPWQRGLRQGGTALTWEEPAVLPPDGNQQWATRPFPGHRTWESAAVVFNYDPRFYSVNSGYTVPDQDATQTVTSKETLKDGYRITLQR